jgi:ubiquinone/menaquinone biosynthesis C-methylase UbiE
MDSNNLHSGHRPKDPSKTAGEVCDYEGSSYRTDFWTQDRQYEDLAERIALRSMLPPHGHRLIEIGAGFGRLVDLYAGYDEVVLFDYSRSMLQEARARWGDAGPHGQPRYIYVAGDFYALPFVQGLFNAATMVRVIHHARDAAQVLRGINEIMVTGGTFVLEFANKRNLKAITRWLARQQTWNPFSSDPYEFAELNFDFHPQWIQDHLRRTGFTIRAVRSVSHFRINMLKSLVPARHLARLDGLIQPSGRWWQLSPSIFVQSQATHPHGAPEGQGYFCCPVCRSTKLTQTARVIHCQDCHRAWSIHDGLYDFKQTL